MPNKTASLNVAATGLLRKGAGCVYGIIVNSHTSGTLKLWNNTSAAVDGTLPVGEQLVCDTFSFPAGSGVYTFPKPIPFTTGLYATVGGTLNCQVVLDPSANPNL